METKGVTCKIPLDLHNQISEEIRETESTVSRSIEMVIREHYEKGDGRVMESGLCSWSRAIHFDRKERAVPLFAKTLGRR